MIQQGDQSQPITGETVVTTLLLTDLVDSTKLVEELGDAKAAEIFVRNDRVARDLLKQYNGKEIDKTDGFLFLFVRPIDAVLYSIAYHHALKGLSEQTNIKLSARAGIHLGEVILYRNSPDDVSRGAKPIEVEGIAKPLAARIMSLAQGGQTLITQAAFDLARRGIVGSDAAPEGTAWVAHGSYMLKGVDEPIEIFEAGVQGVAPLSAPPDSEKAKRSVAAGDEETLGWRPAVGLAVPQRKGWKLDRKIGEGGFGEVWLAINRRTKDRRVFKFCFDADRLRSLKRELTLFRLLRDALGDRKDIAKLYEVQLEEAPFFLESEFTPSGSIVDWAESQGGISNIPIETRLDMVSQTARAVAAAHSVGILHKDIKPANILVYQDENGQPRPRLADFGIGTLTKDGKHEGRNITMAGFTLDLGTDDSSLTTTRMYSPPELLAGRPFTVLGDIYAVGVFLYQMVVGDLDRPLAQGWERDVADSCLRDDIAVCVEGDEEQRMGSAQGLAKRLETLPQRRRAVRRRRIARIAAVGSGALTILLAVATIWGVREFNARKLADSLRVQAEQAQIVAELRRDIANALNDVILKPMIRAANPTTKRVDAVGGREVTVVEILDDILEEARETLSDTPVVYADVLGTLAVVFKDWDKLDTAEEVARESLAIRQEYYGITSLPAAESLLTLGDVLLYIEEYEEALELYEESLALRLKLLEEKSPQVAESLNGLAACLRRMGRSLEAEAIFRQALQIRRMLLAEEYEGFDPMLVAASENNLALCLRGQGQYEEAERRFRVVLKRAREIFGDEHFYVARTLHNIASCLAGMGQSSEAERYYRDALAMKLKVLGEDHASVAETLLDLAQLLLKNGDPAAAETQLLGALEIRRNASPPVPWRIATTENLLGACLVAQQKYEKAEPLLLDSLQVIRQHWVDQHESVQKAFKRLIELYEKWDKEPLAKPYKDLLTEPAED